MTAAYSPSEKPIGIVGALPAEARALGVPAQRNAIADLRDQARVYLCGVGADNARRAVQALLAAEVAGLVSWGTAGGLADSAVAGTCVVPDSVICGDAAYETDARWCERIASGAEALPLHRGALYSSGELATTPAQKTSLHSETHAAAIDTESGVVADLASSAQVPFICIRAVIDGPGMTLPGFAADGLDEQGFPSMAKMLAALARNPADLTRLPGLVRCFNKARGTLATIRRAAGPRLLGP